MASGELFPRVGFIVTNLPMEPDWVVRFYNQRGTAEQHRKEPRLIVRGAEHRSICCRKRLAYRPLFLRVCTR